MMAPERRKAVAVVLALALVVVVVLSTSVMPAGAAGDDGSDSLFLPVIVGIGTGGTPVPTARPTDSPRVYSISGYVQKGPFVQGTEIEVRELDDELNPTGRTFTGRIDDNTGRFSVRGTLDYPIVELAANGFYFNEVHGGLSAAPISLLALADLRDGLAINVNLLTHLEHARVLALVDGGVGFAEAKAQAQQEVLAIFDLVDHAISNSETLDIAQEGTGNAILLAISMILQGSRSEAQLTELLSILSGDLRADGILDSATARQALVDGMEYVKPRRVAVRDSIVARYTEIGAPADVPPFEQYLFTLDAIAPSVESTYPSADTLQIIGTVDTVTVTFSELMDHDTLTPNSVHLVDAKGIILGGVMEINDSLEQTTVQLTPDNPLVSGNYRHVITGDVQDLAGHALLASTTVDFRVETYVAANGISRSPSISGDGRYVAFGSEASNLVVGDTNGQEDVFVHDRQMGQMTRVLAASSGAETNWTSDEPSISADGRHVAFSSVASNLVTGDTNNDWDVFAHDRQTGTTARVSVSSLGEEGNGMTLYGSSISGDGRYVAFASYASNLVTGDTNGWADVFVHDQQTGQTTRVSVSSAGVQGNEGSWEPSISADGRYVAFASNADNLVPGDTNSNRDVFVHDRQTGQTTRVSVSSAGVQGNEGSGGLSISGDGRYVAFASGASNLVTGDNNNYWDAFVHDQQTGQTTRVSVSSSGLEGNEGSGGPSISADGRYVAFTSGASNLVTGDTNGWADVFVHDRQIGETTRVSMPSSGMEGNGESRDPSISADGRYVAFQSGASNLVTGDMNGTYDVFVHDRQTGETTPVSVRRLE